LITENINNNLEIINQSTLSSDIVKENSYIKRTNKCVFSIFSDFFDKPYSSYKYYPNQYDLNNFFGININTTHVDNKVSTLDYIKSKQFYVLDKTVQQFTKYFNNNELLKYDLNAIAAEFSYYKQYCLTNNNIATICSQR
jgi:hypothetical protein